MGKNTTTRYDVAEHLRTPEEMAAYLEALHGRGEGDASFIAKALGDIARAKGMAQVARDAGLYASLSRESLYKALSGERSPGFDTILKVIGALGGNYTPKPLSTDQGAQQCPLPDRKILNRRRKNVQKNLALCSTGHAVSCFWLCPGG